MKIKPGMDDFCLNCMEWREYDSNGRCKVCKHIIHKLKSNDQMGYNEYNKDLIKYDLEDSEFENDL